MEESKGKTVDELYEEIEKVRETYVKFVQELYQHCRQVREAFVKFSQQQEEELNICKEKIEWMVRETSKAAVGIQKIFGPLEKEYKRIVKKKEEAEKG